MSVAQRKETGFTLYKRAADDIALPRPYNGEHRDLTGKAIRDCEERSREILTELAKI